MTLQLSVDEILQSICRHVLLISSNVRSETYVAMSPNSLFTISRNSLIDLSSLT